MTSVAGQKGKALTKKSKDEEEEEFGDAAKSAVQYEGIDMENLSDIDLNMDMDFFEKATYIITIILYSHCERCTM